MVDLRGAMMRLYAAALDDAAEGALRWLAGRYEEWFGADIEEDMSAAGWTFGRAASGYHRVAWRTPEPDDSQEER
jgi:hypothetical protein